MPTDRVSVVLVHGAWADGSSWGKVIGPLQAAGLTVVAAPHPRTSSASSSTPQVMSQCRRSAWQHPSASRRPRGGGRHPAPIWNQADL
jgi:hypothetical protein